MACPPFRQPAEGQLTQEVTFPVSGMTCASCALRLTTAMQTLDGILAANVSFIAHSATVTVTDVSSLTTIASRMDQMGYAMGELTSVKAVERPTLIAALSFKNYAPSKDWSLLFSHKSMMEHMQQEDMRANRWCQRKTQKQQPEGIPVETGVLIVGMSCTSCAARIERRMREMPGVQKATVNYATMMGTFTHFTSEASTAAVVENIELLGYTATLITSTNTAHTTMAPSTFSTAAVAETTILIDGMPSALCAARIEAKLLSINGLHKASVHDGTGNFQFDPSLLTPTSIAACIADMGCATTITGGASDDGWYLSEGDEKHNVDGSVRIPMRAFTDHADSFSHRRAKGTIEHHLLIEGMSCTSCATRIESALLALPTVTACAVSFGSKCATATTVKGAGSDSAELIRKLNTLGYRATVLDEHGSGRALDKMKQALERTSEIERQRRLFIGSAILCLPLLVAMIIMSFSNLMMTSYMAAVVIDGIQLMCSTLIVLYYGRQFFVGAYHGLRHHTYTMDTLVAIGVGCSYLYSVVVYSVTVLTGMHMMTYFDTAGMLTAFMLLGRYLEANAKRSTSGALIDLMSLVPPMATIVTADGDVQVPSSAIEVGQHVRVLAGDRVPMDGTVLDGYSDIDEQMVTGESVPKHVKPGDAVVGGTLNVTARLIVVADKVGEETMLAHILHIVQEAQNTKPTVQRVADHIAMYFVPFVVCCSLVTLLVWLFLGITNSYPAAWRHGISWESFAFNFFIATVVAACPCALGLATPTAIMVGTGVGAKNGVLVKSGATLEAMRLTNCVVFDKTGTLTRGKMQVVWTACPGVEDPVYMSLVKRLVGTVEAQSNHPIAKVVAESMLQEALSDVGDASISQVDIVSAITHPGKGVEAVVTVTRTGAEGLHSVEHRVLVGNFSLLNDLGITTVSPSFRDINFQQSAKGYTTVVGAVDGVACVIVALSDTPKPESYGIVQALHQKGIRTMMVTGDNHHVAGCIARAVGIAPENVHAEALPATKANIVMQLQSMGYRVAFVGDGINDSPALAQADVGVALGAGTSIAIESADAVLMRNSLVDLLNLYALSIMTVRHIYGNFTWALGYNLVMLPLASGFLYPLLHVQLPPVVAGGAMVMSSLSVLASSLAIQCFRPYREEEYTRGYAVSI